MLGLILGNSLGILRREKMGRGVSFQADGTKQGASVPASLVDALCKSVGVLLVAVRVGDAGALSLDPAEGAAAT